MISRVFLTLVIVSGLAACMTGWKGEKPSAESLEQFADALLATMDEPMRSELVMPFESAERLAWHFVPKDSRKGCPLGSMNDAQRVATLRLVRAALSEAGYTKANRIMALEAILAQLEAGQGRWRRDPLRYYICLFGVPERAADRSWGIRFEGHHLSLNFVCRDGEVVDSTPQFLGASPAVVRDDVPDASVSPGTWVLRLEEQIAFSLMASLSGQSRQQAILSDQAPADLRFAGQAQAAVTPPAGIAFGALNSGQQAKLKELVSLYLDISSEKIAKRRHAVIQQDGWESVYFAWEGALEPGIGHAYRIQGKRFLIELVNTQADPSGNMANHVHTCYRDLSGDFDLPNGSP